MGEPGSGEELLRAIVDEARRLEEDALHNSVGHNEEARAADWMHRWLGVPTTVLAAAAGVTSFSTAGLGTLAGFWASVAAGTLSFSVAALTGVGTFLDPKARAAEHYRASSAYCALRVAVRYFYHIECKKGKGVEELDGQLVALRDRLVKLDEQTPILSAKAAARASAMIKAGEYTNAVDRDRGTGQAEPLYGVPRQDGAPRTGDRVSPPKT